MTLEEVEAKSVAGLPSTTILTKNGKPANAKEVGWWYRYVVIDDTSNPAQYWHLQAKPTHYHVSY
jgi:hypothetical protein